MNCKKLATVVILIFTRYACSAEPTEIPVDVVAVAKSGNEFATDLYARLASEKSANLFFSPYSISTALAMTYAGAKGQTEVQMAKVLHFPVPQAELHPALHKLNALLNSTEKTPGFEFRIANRLWGQKGFQFLPEFVQVTKSNYGAELGLLDFKKSDAARQTINSWIETQTDRKIQDLIAPGVLDDKTRLVLTNAIYFKARWRREFNDRATTDAPFHATGSQQVMVPMMYQSNRFRYGESENVQVLELPYDDGGKVSMLILLPKKIVGLGELEQRLTNEDLRMWSSGLKSRDVNVHLPKFKMTSEFDLGDVLKKMGMPLAFSDGADFSGMSTGMQLFISAVIHKAFVELNEEGTEAAAATAIRVEATSLTIPQTPVEFRADHPFVFLIRDNGTQSVLFLGRLVNPKR